MTALLVPPVVSLMVLVALAAVTTAEDLAETARVRHVEGALLQPARTFVTSVQAERSAAVSYLTDPTDRHRSNLGMQAARTEAAIGVLRNEVDASSSDAATVGSELPDRIDLLLQDAEGLPKLREAVAAGTDTLDVVFTTYSKAIQHCFELDRALSELQHRDNSEASFALLQVSQAKETIAQENDLAGAAQASGQMRKSQHNTFLSAADARAVLFGMELEAGDLPPRAGVLYRTMLASPSYQTVRSLESAVERAGAGAGAARAVSAVAWNKPAQSMLLQLDKTEQAIPLPSPDSGNNIGFDLLGGSGAAIIVGLAGVLFSMLAAVQIGRTLIVDLVGLRNAALHLARHELPRSLERVDGGEEVDIDVEATPLQPHEDDTLGQVRAALRVVHRVVLVGAVERAKLRATVERAAVLSGISSVYVNLARRSQVLLHRQLSLLDEMERRSDNPAELEDLFRLDHLTSRMRRQAESLVILSGAPPARGWRNPVPVMDVVRAAVSEVEDYPRVDVLGIPEAHMAGPAIADITHLLAELVENAVVFSPPHTKVIVRGEQVGSGVVLEVEDRGLGMGPDAMAEANGRICQAEVDLQETQQLGLFVVNRLSHRQNVSVTLQRSSYGGVLAVVLIPDRLLAPPPPQATAPPAERHESPSPTAHLHQVTPLHRRGHAVPRPASLQAGKPHRSSPETPSLPGTDDEPPSASPAQDPSGLPRRVRQASLAPQLRDAPQHTRQQNPTGTSAHPHPVSWRSPEEAQALMNRLRAGWQRGQEASAASTNTEKPSQGERS
ncbi:nitrate- and nitrite sensing domain-containing protein [Streptomyces sp. NPDC020801]|uniref:sensor histidine kinase n=1 Tax=Streptomyces sp. NPDC020801 TaxID=3365093 RepID=UPI0037A7B67F